MTKQLKYQIALTLIPGIGPIVAKKLIAYCGGAEAVFKQPKSHLQKIPSVGEKVASSIQHAALFKRVEKELEFLEANQVKAHFFLDDSYPNRLLHCEDGPILLYTKGNIDLDAERTISIVGTRKATIKGKHFCEQLIEGLAAYQPTIISGLAYGIDITAHRAAIKNQIPTLGVLACGLDEVYPKSHAKTVNQMMEYGGIASEYRSNTNLLPAQFVERNRIIAGLSDAVIVIESSEKGGSLITADLANGYHRDVFAVPGRPGDSQSAGCNKLIKSNKAALIESVRDIEYLMGWEVQEIPKKQVQNQLFQDLNKEEKTILSALRGQAVSVDQLSLTTHLPMRKTTSVLLSLEFKNLVKSLPGKMYQLS